MAKGTAKATAKESTNETSTRDHASSGRLRCRLPQTGGAAASDDADYCRQLAADSGAARRDRRSDPERAGEGRLDSRLAWPRSEELRGRRAEGVGGSGRVEEIRGGVQEGGVEPETLLPAHGEKDLALVPSPRCAGRGWREAPGEGLSYGANPTC